VAKSSIITEEFEAIKAALEALEPLEENQRRFAVSMILARLGMTGLPTIVNGTTGPQSAAGAGAGLGAAASSGTGLDGVKGMTAKQFLKLKNPATDLERFVCLGYYVTHAKETQSFTTRDVTKLNDEAHGTEFSNAAATAMNAVNQSRFLSRAGDGKKRITTLGESVVEALPDRAKLKEVLAAAPRRSKAKGRKRRAKA